MEENEREGRQWKDRWLPGRDVAEQVEHRGLFRAVKTFCMITMRVNPCRYTFVQTHGMSNTESEPSRKRWAWADNLSVEAHRS